MNSRILERRGIESEGLFKALASDTRLNILSLLADRDMNIFEMSRALGIAHPSVSKHVQILEQAGLISSEYMSGEQGTQKRCRLRYDRLLISLESLAVPLSQFAEIEMPLGMYTRVEPHLTCGMASRDKVIGYFDEPLNFFLPERAQAQILWIGAGFVEYVFVNAIPTSQEIWRLELSMEVCSECPDYNNDYPSDITVWINDVEIGTWTSPGDMGSKRGRLNPPWWVDNLNQFGFLKVWSVDSQGAYVDGSTVSDIRISELNVAPRHPITVRIGIKPNAEHSGGLSLFGRGFGNYDQDLVLRLCHRAKERSGPALLTPQSSLKQEGEKV